MLGESSTRGQLIDFQGGEVEGVIMLVQEFYINMLNAEGILFLWKLGLYDVSEVSYIALQLRFNLFFKINRNLDLAILIEVYNVYIGFKRIPG